MNVHMRSFYIHKMLTRFPTWITRNCPTSKSCLFPMPRLTYREWIGQLLRTYKAADKQVVAVFTEAVAIVWMSTELTSVWVLSVVIFMDTVLFVQLLAAEIKDFFWIDTIYVTHCCQIQSSIFSPRVDLKEFCIWIEATLSTYVQYTDFYIPFSTLDGIKSHQTQTMQTIETMWTWYFSPTCLVFLLTFDLHFFRPTQSVWSTESAVCMVCIFAWRLKVLRRIRH